MDGTVNNGGNTSVHGNNNSVSGASNNGFNSIPSRKYSYGGGETLAANRAAAGKKLGLFSFVAVFSCFILFPATHSCGGCAGCNCIQASS